MLLTMAHIGMEIKGKRNKGEKSTLEEKNWGASLHTDHRKRPRLAKSRSGWEDSFLRNNKYVSAKAEKMSEEVLKTKKPKSTENQRETQESPKCEH